MNTGVETRTGGDRELKSKRDKDLNVKGTVTTKSNKKPIVSVRQTQWQKGSVPDKVPDKTSFEVSRLDEEGGKTFYLEIRYTLR